MPSNLRATSLQTGAHALVALAPAHVCVRTSACRGLRRIPARNCTKAVAARVCVWICFCVSVCLCAHMSVRVCVCARARVCTRVFACVCVCECVCIKCVRVCALQCVRVRVCAGACAAAESPAASSRVACCRTGRCNECTAPPGTRARCGFVLRCNAVRCAARGERIKRRRSALQPRPSQQE